MPNTKAIKFEAVPATACWGIENCKEFFFLAMTRKPFLLRLKLVPSTTKTTIFFLDSSGVVSRTFDQWRDMLNDAYKLIKSLRAEHFESRAKTRKSLGEKEKAESYCLNATFSLDLTQAELHEAQEAMNAMSLSRASESAGKEHKMQTCKKGISTRLLSRSLGKTALRGFGRREPLAIKPACRGHRRLR